MQILKRRKERWGYGEASASEASKLKLRVAKDGFPPLVTMPMETELQKQLPLARFAIGMMRKIGLFIQAVIQLAEVIIPTMRTEIF